MTDLGTLDVPEGVRAFSVANGINDRGEVVTVLLREEEGTIVSLMRLY